MKEVHKYNSRSYVRLFWKNGGWMTLVIICTMVILSFVAFNAVAPVLQWERILNVKTTVFHLSESFQELASSVRNNMWNTVLKKKDIMFNPDSALSACSEILNQEDFISGVSIAYLKEIPNRRNMTHPFVFKGREKDTIIDISDFKHDELHDWDLIRSFFADHPNSQLYIGNFQSFPFMDSPCIPLTIPVTFESNEIDAFITVYPNSNVTRQRLLSYNPFPEGSYYLINSQNSLFAATSCDSLFNLPAFPWLKEHYGEKMVSKLRSLPEDDIIAFSDGEFTFFAGYVYSGLRIYIYSVPTSVFTEDLVQIAVRILIYGLIGFILILLVCIQTARKNSSIALSRELVRKEMETMAAIQTDMLSKIPKNIPPVGMDALLIPAKSVGGDLYYCFQRDDSIYFCVGDVSGKGMPASMFMAKTVSLFKFITRSAVSANEIAEKLNGELVQDNETNMFVTIFIGILDIHTGVLRFCNAGHDEPLLWNGNEATVPEFLQTSTNLPLGVEGGMPFVEGKMKLDAGSVLMLYTDGVTEAMNEKSELYGEGRLSKLFETALSSSPESINSGLLADIRAFAGKREQSDDITIFTIKFKSLDETVTFTETPETLSQLKFFFNRIADVLVLDRETCTTLRSAVDEAVTNVVKHGFTDYPADIVPKITLHAKTGEGKIRFTIEDNGIPFNPLTYSAPDIKDIPNTDVMDIQIGGLGIPMITFAFDEILYDRKKGHNILTLIKSI